MKQQQRYRRAWSLGNVLLLIVALLLFVFSYLPASAQTATPTPTVTPNPVMNNPAAPVDLTAPPLQTYVANQSYNVPSGDGFMAGGDLGHDVFAWSCYGPDLGVWFLYRIDNGAWAATDCNAPRMDSVRVNRTQRFEWKFSGAYGAGTVKPANLWIVGYDDLVVDVNADTANSGLLFYGKAQLYAQQRFQVRVNRVPSSLTADGNGQGNTGAYFYVVPDGSTLQYVGGANNGIVKTFTPTAEGAGAVLLYARPDWSPARPGVVRITGTGFQPTMTPTLPPTVTSTPAPTSPGDLPPLANCDRYEIPANSVRDIQIGRFVTDNPRLYSERGRVRILTQANTWRDIGSGINLSSVGPGGAIYSFSSEGEAVQDGGALVLLPGILRVCWPAPGVTSTPLVTPTKAPTVTPFPTLNAPTSTSLPLPSPTTPPTYTPLPTYTPFPALPTPTADPDCAAGPVDGKDCEIIANQQTAIALQQTQIAQGQFPGKFQEPGPAPSRVPVTMATVQSRFANKEPFASIGEGYDGVRGALDDIASASGDCYTIADASGTGPYALDGAKVAEGFCRFISSTERARFYMRAASIVIFGLLVVRYLVRTIRRIGDV